MRRRALTGALSIAFLVPLISAWCIQCFSGECPMGAASESLKTATAEQPCHSAPAGSEPSEPSVTTTADDCCHMTMASSATGAPIEAVHFSFDLEQALGEEVRGTPLVTRGAGEPPPPPLPQGASTPLFTLHSSLLL